MAEKDAGVVRSGFLFSRRAGSRLKNVFFSVQLNAVKYNNSFAP
ncbi:hypothetical protein EVA_13233 [gut metagenome]|uniref:Uncharacterized protein n=1 Tax=gut metagenome TaxID=749906 RepID=J9CF91_9ZZZZ